MRLAFSKSLHAGNRLTFTFIPLRVIVSLRGTLSSAFGAALLQGPTRWGLSRIGFHTAAGIHPAPLARPFSKGLPASGYLTFAFIPLRRIGFKQSQAFLDDVFYVLPYVFEIVLDVKV